LKRTAFRLEQMKLRINIVVLIGVLVLAAAMTVRACRRRDIRDFAPAEVARAEAAMWKAYYAGNREKLGLNLVLLLHDQYGLSFYRAKQIAAELGAAAMQFRATRADYEDIVLPKLEKAYRLIRRSTGARFDPQAAAKAELDWWVARRTPGRNSPEAVGREIAQLYAVLYGSAQSSFEQAGVLRAQAAALRDLEGESADWPQIESLLRQSYQILKHALAE
jgi:hypothetical protein